MPETFAPGQGNLDFDATTVVDLILKPIYHTDEEKGSITLSYLLDHAHSTVISSYNYHQRDAFAHLGTEINVRLAEIQKGIPFPRSHSGLHLHGIIVFCS